MKLWNIVDRADNIFEDRGIIFYDDNFIREYVSYKEVYRKASVLAKNMRLRGVENRAMVILQMHKKQEFIIALWASIICGCQIIPLEVADEMELNEERLYSVKKQYPYAWIIYDDEVNISDNMEFSYRMLSYQYLSKGDNIHELGYEYHEKDTLLVQFTSGSTGECKGVKLTWENISANLQQMADNIKLTNKDVTVNWMPLAHAMGLVLFHFLPVYVGGNQVHISKEMFIKRPDRYFDILEKERATIIGFPNFAFSYLCNWAKSNLNELMDLSSIRYIYNGGEPIIKKRVDEFERLFGQYGLRQGVVHAIYGMTEAVAIVSAQPLEKGMETVVVEPSQFYDGVIEEVTDSGIEIVSVGEVLEGNKVIISGDDGNLLPDDVIGNVLIQGASIAEEVREVNGYYTSGDMGFFHNKKLFITGRKKDLIFFNGQNFYAQDIERNCEEISGIKQGDIVVCGVTNYRESKEEMVVFFVSENDTDKELHKKIAEKLFQIINQKATHIIAVKEIPKTRSGKKQRFKLKEAYLRGKFSDSIIQVEKRMEEEKEDWKDEIEKAVIEAFKECFKSRIAQDDEFGNLGGDSLKMLEIIGKLEKNLKCRISPGMFLKLRTPEKIAQYIRDNGKRYFDEYPMVVADRENIYKAFPLTDIQAAYFAGRNKEFELGNVSTHLYYQIETKLDIQRLENSFNMLIKQHPMLRVIITEDGRQKILEKVAWYKFKIIDVQQKEIKDIKKYECEIEGTMSHQIFTPNQWPLFEIQVLKTPNANYLFLSFDMLTMDGASLGILIKQWLEIYAQNTIHKGGPELSFRDYVLALSEIKQTDLYRKDRDYWKKKLEFFANAPELPTKMPLKSIETPHFTRKSIRFDCLEWKRIKEFATKNSVTAASILLTAYMDVLAAYSNQERLAVCTTLFNRYPVHKDVNSIIGDFTSLMLIEGDYSENNSFEERVRTTYKNLITGLAHRHYDGMEFIRDIQEYRNMPGCAIMPVVFTSMIFEGEQYGEFTDLGKIVNGVSQTSQVLLDCQIRLQRGELVITWDYVDNLLEQEIVNNMFEQYVTLLHGVSGNAVEKVCLNPGLIEKIEHYNDTAQQLEESNVVEKFRDMVKMYPQKTAVIEGNQSISYVELESQSNRVAVYLLEKGIQKGDFVGVFAERNIATIVNVLGILKCGAAYVALEVSAKY